MAGEFGEHVASLQGDHRRLDAAFADLLTEPTPPPGWQQQLESAVSGLFEHVLREQDGLFPASLSVLTAEQWDHLDAVRTELAAPADPVPAPEPVAGKQRAAVTIRSELLTDDR